MYKVVDLFAGAGGLSLGFVQTGEFKIVAAAENNPKAKETYHLNHPHTKLYDDVREIDYQEIIDRYGQIDVVIGGPPCQGFSNANRQKAQHISSNNELVKEYMRAVRELKPKIFIMENVGSICSETHRFYYSKKDIEFVNKSKIKLRDDLVEIMPAYKRIKQYQDEITTALEHFKDYLWDQAFFQSINTIYRKRGNEDKAKEALQKHEKRIQERMAAHEYDENHWGARQYQAVQHGIEEYYDNMISFAQLIEIIEFPVLLQKMCHHLQDLDKNEIIIDGYDYTKGVCVRVKSFSVLDYITAVLNTITPKYNIKKDILNAAEFGAPQKRERFILMGNKIGTKLVWPEGIIHDEEKYRTVRNAIFDLEKVPVSTDANTKPQNKKIVVENSDSPLCFLSNNGMIYNHIVTKTSPLAQKRFEAIPEGGNFHSLPPELKETYSDAKRTQSTIYLKLVYDKPCGTVVNVRKSMWIHPKNNRAISVREAARLQTFPDSFIFMGTKDSQYQQVGNAVPPILAKAIAMAVLPQLKAFKE